MRDYGIELKNRVAFIKKVVEDAGVEGIVFGNSGGKDSALVGILCKMACENTVGIIMPCGSGRNYKEDKQDAESVANKFNIEIRIVDLKQSFEEVKKAVSNATTLNGIATTNIAPRLRMTTLYAIAASENRLVAGTGNKSEGHMGYFTKFGDGGHDFNPISDLTVTEIFEFLRYLEAPISIIEKAPSAGLFDGQTDELEMGVSYAAIDKYLSGEQVTEQEKVIIERYHNRSHHKRRMPLKFAEN